MASQQASVARPASHARAVPWTLLSYLVIALVAVVPRVADLGLFVTEDEANFWLRRSEIFLNALRSGNWGATAVTDHPGVTTMWLGSAGILLRRALFAAGLLRDDSFATILALMRLPAALVHAGVILLGYGLLRRMLPASLAVLAALLWALDPFVIAYSRVLHVDALAGTFATLSVIAACRYWHHTQRPTALVLSASCAALSMLSKSPGAVLFPVVGVIALAAAWNRPGWRARIAGAAPAFLGWCVVCIAMIFVLWPALWVSPYEAYQKIRVGIVVEGAQPHQLGNFFLGRQDDTPGPHFYLLTIALRLTPWTLLGLLLAPWAWRGAPRPARRDLLALAWYALLFTVAMSLFPKKFNRYLVPAFPALDILAAAGLVWLGESIARIHRLGSARRFAPAALLSGLTLAAVLNVVYWHPYPIAAFNQALGGARAGSRAFMVGWGEGFEQAAAWLNRQPNITGVLTLNSLTATLEPYMRPGAQAVNAIQPTLPPKTGYVVVHVRDVQTGKAYPPFDQFYGKATPLHTVRIHGVEYAWIYAAPPDVAQQRSAHFGEAIRLHGYTLASAPRRGAALVFLLGWEARERPAADYMLFAHLVGPNGQRYAQVDLPYGTGSWEAGRYTLSELPLAVPADAPAGNYRLLIGLYDPVTGERLPLDPDVAADPALDGPHALLLSQIELE